MWCQEATIFLGNYLGQWKITFWNRIWTIFHNIISTCSKCLCFQVLKKTHFLLFIDHESNLLSPISVPLRFCFFFYSKSLFSSWCVNILRGLKRRKCGWIYSIWNHFRFLGWVELSLFYLAFIKIKHVFSFFFFFFFHRCEAFSNLYLTEVYCTQISLGRGRMRP